jgi:hypothetical protein
MVVLGSLLLALQVSVTSDVNRSGGSVSVKMPVTKRVEVTEEMRRTAFKDPAARELLLRAREARLTQDSALLSYDVKSYQRVSVGMSLRASARERLAFRNESASRVRWHRDVGARVEVLGARSVAPIVQGAKGAEDDIVDDTDFSDMMAIPYYPGMDELWLFNMIGSSEKEGNILVHPIAEGSEAYFTFATGDSVSMTLPDGKRLALRELRVTPRAAQWNLVVGSLWFELEQAHLVRAVMRFSAPMDVWQTAKNEDPDFDDDVPALVKPMLTPMQADLTALTVEYGLFNQRFWLPRVQGAELWARVSFLRVPVKVEQRYRYESVNAIDSLPAIAIPTQVTASSVRDSLYESGLDSAAPSPTIRRATRTPSSRSRSSSHATCPSCSTPPICRAPSTIRARNSSAPGSALSCSRRSTSASSRRGRLSARSTSTGWLIRGSTGWRGCPPVRSRRSRSARATRQR